MKSDNAIKILHISDLHLTANSHDQDAVLNSLYDRIEEIVKDGTSIDLVAFSGDLASKGDFSETARMKMTAFFKSLHDCTKLNQERFFFCPGNHDANLNKLNLFSRKGLEAIGTRDESNSFVDQPGEEALKQFEEFKNMLVEALGTSPYNHPLYYTRIVKLKELEIGIAVFNTAWRCRGLADNKDYGHLLVGVNQVELALKELSSCKFRIALMHHPVNWLAPFEQQYVNRALTANFQLVLSGHNHSPDAHSIADGHSISLTSNAGCLYQNREYFNGFSMISADFISGAFVIQGNEYFREREGFSPTARFGNNGLRSFSISGDTTVLEFAKPELIEAVHGRVNSQLLSYSASGVAPKTLEGVFVEPILSSQSHPIPENMRGKSEESKPHEYHLHELLQQEKQVVLMGRRESGKTTLVNYVAANFNKFRLDNVITACVIDCDRLKKRRTQAAILELAAQFYASYVSIKDIKALSSRGQLLYCFDGIASDDHELIKLIHEFISANAANRYIVACTETINQTMSDETLPIDTPQSGIKLLGKLVYIKDFRRKHTKELVQKWFGCSDSSAGDHIEKVTVLLKKLGVPRTPFLVSLVLWVLENNPNADLINQAAVLEAMVDGLLGKLTESKSRSRLDARLKTLFLMDFAYQLYLKDDHRFERVAVERFIAEYFSTKGWKESAFELLKELLDKGLLIEIDEQIQFKFDCFRAFFLGQKLNEDATFFTHAMSRENLPKLHAEIDYATGLSRNRKEYLDAIFDLCRQIESEAQLIDSLSSLESAKPMAVILDGDHKKQLKERFEQIDATGSHREIFLDRIEEMDDADEQDESLPDKGSPDELPENTRKRAELITVLVTLGVVIRNSEALNEDAKNEPLKWLINKFSLLIAHEYTTIESKREFLLQEANGSIEQAERVEHLVKILIPSVVIQILVEHLATPKLGKLFEDNFAESPHMIERLFYLGCMLGAQTDGCVARFQEFLDAGQRQSILKELGYMVGSYSLISKKWAHNDVERLKDILINYMDKTISTDHKKLDRSKTRAHLEKSIQKSDVA